MEDVNEHRENFDMSALGDLFKAKGLEKVYPVDRNPYCTLFLVIHNRNQYLVAVFAGNNSWYSKIVPAHIVLEPYWRCGHLLYVPEGLFTFADTIPKLINKIIKVLERYGKSSM